MQTDARPKTTYEQWMEGEGLPISEALGGIEDVTELPRGPWPRLGGRGAFIQLRGTVEAGQGIYVAEIPSGGALNPERHVYEEVIYILRGRGLTEVWQEGGPRQTFEWGGGSLFAPPINAWHQLINGGREPVIFLAVTTAPQMMDTYHNIDFIFNCDYQFSDRYGGQSDYFNPGDKRYRTGLSNVWETNFIPSVLTAALEDQERKVSAGQLTSFEMSGNMLVGHISQWPTGRYHKAHWHDAGALLLGLKGKGYVMLWPKEAGIHPFRDGHEDAVLKLNWKPGSIYTPPGGWFHQHFNSGAEPARHLAVRYGSRLYRLGSFRVMGSDALFTSVKEGGTLIEYDDEDPGIRQHFEQSLREDGIECQMPAVAHRQ